MATITASNLDQLKILVVDDDPAILEIVTAYLANEGFDVMAATNGSAALTLAKRINPDVVITDIRMPEKDGLTLTAELKSYNSHIDVIVMTAFSDKESILQALRLNVYDYLIKPFDLLELRSRINHLAEKYAIVRRDAKLRRDQVAHQFRNYIIGDSPRMRTIFDTVVKLSDSDCNVLITGESGSGKELVARAIHNSSQRCDREYVVVDCGSLNDNLLESELYGHVKGAFTGAQYNKVGFLEHAHRGTLMLDEINSSSPAFQSRLLRVIEEGEFKKVGSTETMKVDIRFVSISNVPLEEKVADGSFRKDLYYRLNVVNIQVPALRERPEDIPAIVQHFIEEFASSDPSKLVNVSDEALALMLQYEWPGNVRQLRNVVERALVIGNKEVLLPQDLPPEITVSMKKTVITGETSLQTLKNAEDDLIFKALKTTNGHREDAARLLGISVRTLYRKLRRFNHYSAFYTPSEKNPPARLRGQDRD
jgi:DNA-binding NtrC family response regulator